MASCPVLSSLRKLQGQNIVFQSTQLTAFNVGFCGTADALFTARRRPQGRLNPSRHAPEEPQRALPRRRLASPGAQSGAHTRQSPAFEAEHQHALWAGAPTGTQRLASSLARLEQLEDSELRRHNPLLRPASQEQRKNSGAEVDAHGEAPLLQSAACELPGEAGQSKSGQGEHGRRAAAEEGLPMGAADREVEDDSIYDDASEVPLPSGRTVYGTRGEYSEGTVYAAELCICDALNRCSLLQPHVTTACNGMQ